jgi:DNA polymerase-3 subunit alpha
VITSLQRKWTKAGDLMAVFQLEDLQGSMEVMVFPKTMSVVGHKLTDDAVVVVKGKLDKRDDEPKLICMDVDIFELADGGQPFVIRMPTVLSDTAVTRLKAILSEHPGEVEVHLQLSADKRLRLSDEFRVNPHRGLVGALKEAFGDCLV